MSDRPPDDSIARVFAGERVIARFAVAMGMATNDIERALRDVMLAREHDTPDLTYRVRLVIGHLVEALDSLNAYSCEFEDVRTLMRRVDKKGQGSLKIARGTMQNVGPDALKHARDTTFHYPSPKKNYSPTSDEQLRHVLGGMSARRADFHVDFDTNHVTLTFADEVALAMSMGKHAPDQEDSRRQFELTRDGALAFIAWAQRLLMAYFQATDAHLGEPEFSPKCREDDSLDVPAGDRAHMPPPFFRPFGADIPDSLQRMHLLILAVFVIAGTVLAVAWTGATAYPPRELFVAIAGVNAALVVAMAVEAREVQNRFERWIQTGVAGLVAMTLLSSLIGRSCCSRG